ncbi:TRMT1-like protein [Patella vulgata]|uniref:TRMT1-like protein n=1 Tax=Patella vulgata TaxID=6465 RepID=UPI0024A917B5|nr:TRMT1-like protein [Patella vulgata]
MSMDDFLLISVKSHRGPHLADKANQRLRWLLHCRFCEERVFLPKQKAPIENPYNLLPCKCNSEKPGKTAVELGPLWSGPIFNPTFLSKIKSSAQESDLSAKTMLLLDTMMEEAGCIIATGENNSNLLDENLNNPNKESLDLKREEFSDNLSDEKCGNKTSEVSDNQSESVHEKSAGEKRLHEDCPDQPAKRLKRANVNNIEETDLWSHSFLPFYYNTHRWKVSHTKLPKVTTLVQLLKSDGYKATKTHFDPKSVRTDANLIQIKQTLDKHCSVKH